MKGVGVYSVRGCQSTSQSPETACWAPLVYLCTCPPPRAAAVYCTAAAWGGGRRWVRRNCCSGEALAIFRMPAKMTYTYKLSDKVVMYHFEDESGDRNNDYAAACDQFMAKPWGLVKECLKMVYPKDSKEALRRKLVRLMDHEIDMWIKFQDDSEVNFLSFPPPQMKEKYKGLPW